MSSCTLHNKEFDVRWQAQPLARAWEGRQQGVHSPAAACGCWPSSPASFGGAAGAGWAGRGGTREGAFESAPVSSYRGGGQTFRITLAGAIIASTCGSGCRRAGGTLPTQPMRPPPSAAGRGRAQRAPAHQAAARRSAGRTCCPPSVSSCHENSLRPAGRAHDRACVQVSARRGGRRRAQAASRADRHSTRQRLCLLVQGCWADPTHPLPSPSCPAPRRQPSRKKACRWQRKRRRPT